MNAATRRRGLLFGVIGVLVFAGAVVAMLMGSDPAAAPRVDPGAVDLSALDRVPAATWDALAQKRVFFGHQSVGADIVSGLEAITKRKPQIKLRIVESSDAAAFEQPGFVHAKVGANESVDSKLSDFAAFMKGPLGARADIAFMKFCYVDLFSGGDPGAIFEKYKRMVGDVAAARPNVKLVHLTMPVTTVEAGAKAKVKKMLGKALGGYAHNQVRNQYNAFVLSEFGARGAAVFDVAAAESKLPDGRVAQFESGGRQNACLSSGYTTDGGHLNEAGKLTAARDLLLVLAEQCR